jgi:Lar family restriction alleviation protein
MPITNLSLEPGDKVRGCPFCGGADIQVYNTHTACYTVTCEGCDAEVHGPQVAPRTKSHRLTEAHHREAKDSALAKWNMRAKVAS